MELILIATNLNTRTSLISRGRIVLGSILAKLAQYMTRKDPFPPTCSLCSRSRKRSLTPDNPSEVRILIGSLGFERNGWRSQRLARVLHLSGDKSQRNIGTPYVERVRRGRLSVRRRVSVHQVPVRVVLDDVTGAVEPTIQVSGLSTLVCASSFLPIVEDLTPKDVSANPPTVCPSLGSKPIVAQSLRVEVVHLVAGVVHVGGCRLRINAEEKALPRKSAREDMEYD